MNVGQAVDREVVLNDVELLTGCRPAATQYDDRKWAIVLPMSLTNACSHCRACASGGAFSRLRYSLHLYWTRYCPIAVVREFLGGLFGADGHAPVLHRWGEREEDATLETPAYSQSAIPEHVERQKQVMGEILGLLARCGVNTDGAKVYVLSDSACDLLLSSGSGWPPAS